MAITQKHEAVLRVLLESQILIPPETILALADSPENFGETGKKVWTHLLTAPPVLYGGVVWKTPYQLLIEAKPSTFWSRVKPFLSEELRSVLDHLPSEIRGQETSRDSLLTSVMTDPVLLPILARVDAEIPQDSRQTRYAVVGCGAGLSVDTRYCESVAPSKTVYLEPNPDCAVYHSAFPSGRVVLKTVQEACKQWDSSTAPLLWTLTNVVTVLQKSERLEMFQELRQVIPPQGRVVVMDTYTYGNNFVLEEMLYYQAQGKLCMPVSIFGTAKTGENFFYLCDDTLRNRQLWVQFMAQSNALSEPYGTFWKRRSTEDQAAIGRLYQDPQEWVRFWILNPLLLSPDEIRVFEIGLFMKITIQKVSVWDRYREQFRMEAGSAGFKIDRFERVFMSGTLAPATVRGIEEHDPYKRTPLGTDRPFLGKKFFAGVSGSYESFLDSRVCYDFSIAVWVLRP